MDGEGGGRAGEVVRTWGLLCRSYMPMVAATRGTLSMTAEAMPMAVAMICSLGTCCCRKTATDLRMPAESRAPMDSRMPKKKRMPDTSILDSAAGTRRPSSSSPVRSR